MFICKICNPKLGGNVYCAEHSTGGTAYVMPNTQPKICEHEIGRKAIGGFAGHKHVHSTGNQFCLKCRKYLTEIISGNFLFSDLLKQKSAEIEEELKKLKDWEELQVGESEQIDECIKIIKQILR